MIASTLRQVVVVAACAFVAAATGNAMAADASSWDGDAHAAMRLVAGTAAPGAAPRAGIEIRLAPGWKTYWRYPGDSGVPPVFDFSKSDNVKSVAVEWPAPHRFTDEGGASIGYKRGVLLPLRIVANDPKRPVTLRLGIDYAICEKLCMPAKGEAALDLAGGGPANDAPLAAAQALVPRPAALGADAALAIRAVRREANGARPRIVVDVAAPAAVPLDLFVEGPTDDWALPLPEPIDGGAPGTSGLRRFAFDLDGVPPGADTVGARLRFTLVSGDTAIEVTAVPR
jgi:DsbC/DsbD-like thiol-disulfide interchange protein